MNPFPNILLGVQVIIPDLMDPHFIHEIIIFNTFIPESKWEFTISFPLPISNVERFSIHWWEIEAYTWNRFLFFER